MDLYIYDVNKTNLNGCATTCSPFNSNMGDIEGANTDKFQLVSDIVVGFSNFRHMHISAAVSAYLESSTFSYAIILQIHIIYVSHKRKFFGQYQINIVL